MCVSFSALSVTVFLADVDSATAPASPSFRWLDAAGTPYAPSYVETYTYAQARVVFEYTAAAPVFAGRLVAENLKPNFAYQVKLTVPADSDEVERLGRVGRYWREEWSGEGWINGWNLNDKGNGCYPTPNDWFYLVTRDAPDSTSPTGLRFRYAGYLLLDYFVTDAQGNAEIEVELNSSYHVLWRSDQRLRSSLDGPSRTASIRVAAASRAYDSDQPDTQVTVFGEWERLPGGGIRLEPGPYACTLMVTEESFHETEDGAGFWAAAMAAPVAFEIGEPPCFALHPQGVLVHSGQAFSLQAALEDSADEPVLRWFRDGAALPEAAAPELVVAAATAAHEGVYHCLATNAFGETLSRRVAVWVRDDVFSEHDLQQAVALATADSDGDGVSDAQERLRDTDPHSYTLTLRPGWNLLSLARMPEDNSLAGIFAAASGMLDGPAWIWVDGGYVPTWQMEPGLGHWIRWNGPQQNLPIRLP